QGHTAVGVRQIIKPYRCDGRGVICVFGYPIFRNEMSGVVMRTVNDRRIVYAILYGNGGVYQSVVFVRRVDLKPAVFPGVSIYGLNGPIAPIREWAQARHRAAVDVTEHRIGFDKRIDKCDSTNTPGLWITTL